MESTSAAADARTSLSLSLKHAQDFGGKGPPNKVMSNKLPFWAVKHVKSIKFLMAP